MLFGPWEISAVLTGKYIIDTIIIREKSTAGRIQVFGRGHRWNALFRITQDLCRTVAPCCETERPGFFRSKCMSGLIAELHEI